MITHFYRSKFDIENLSRLKTLIPDSVDRADYKRVVVNKPWGHEYLMFENPHAAVWILFFKSAGHMNSMHCHPTKKTSIIVLDGNVTCHTLDGWLERKAGQGVVIDEAVFHTTKALSKNGAVVMEVESPPNKKDLVRLKDQYGRENLGYEGASNMSKDVKKYEHIDFFGFKRSRTQTKRLRDCMISVSFHKKSSDFQQTIQHEKDRLICLLQGKLHGADGRVVLSTGEVAAVSEIQKHSNIYAFSDIVYLSLRYV